MISTAIVGASGYTGFELLKLLNSRDDVTIEHVTADANAGKYVSDVFPQFSGVTELMFEKYDASALNSVDVVFLCLPHGESMRIMPGLTRSGVKIIDLGGDFRLTDSAQYTEYYNFSHSCPELLDQFVYGLTEIYRSSISNARFVANPGCYPTGILLSLIPALKNKLISNSNIVINSLSGITGAGKKLSAEYSFAELNDNIQAYKINVHQHIPEIEQILEDETGKGASFTFIPQLVPLNRGIYTTIVCDLASSFTEKDMNSIYSDYYADSNFVRIKKTIPRLTDVVNTNYCDIFFRLDSSTGKLVIISALDNLLKGAAGQAIQNMNLMFQLPEHKGLANRMSAYV